MSKVTIEDVLKKYETYVSNINWHIETNEPKGHDMEICQIKKDAYEEIVSNLASLNRQGWTRGAELIAEERQRQLEIEKWDYDHDEDYKNGELIGAAACYAVNALNKDGIKSRVQIHLEAESSFFSGNTGDRGDRQLRKAGWYDAWPWDEQWDKRSKHDKQRSLVIAGALIAAELDRMTLDATTK